MDQASEDLSTHVTSLRRYAIALMRDPVEADDLVQESLQAALASLRKGHDVRNLKAYLFAILQNTRARRLREMYNNANHVQIEQVADTLLIDGNQEARAELTILLGAINQLPKEQREVMLLVSLEGFSYRETAAIAGVPVGTVMSRLARGRKALNERMAQQKPVVLKRVK